TTVFVYNSAGQLVAEYGSATSNGGASYLTTDHLGSTRVVTAGAGNPSAAGTVLARYDYQPFGAYIPVATGARHSVSDYGLSDDTKQKFTSKERDAESGLDSSYARYYSFQQCRFASADPLLASARPAAPQSWNRFAYCLASPLRLVDPDGREVHVLDQ